jgi:transcriptional regulator of aromatic amino acid metabolism
MSEFPEERFGTSAELLKLLRERSDDFDRVEMMVVNDLLLTGPEGQTKIAKNCCCTIRLCNGTRLLIHRDEFETLLNDGILQRLKIPISLTPLVEQ